MPTAVTMREVGPRDGIQSLGAFIDTPRKTELIDALSQTGLRRIEATSFVHPKAVPQMADAAEVMAGIHRQPGVSYEALVPNPVGAQRAVEVGSDMIFMVVAVSDAFNLKNVRMTVDQSMDSLVAVTEISDSAGTPLILGMATSFGCPYAGEVTPEQVERVVRRGVELGIREFDVADTTGMANPLQVQRLMTRLRDGFPDVGFCLHFHNTRGMGLANVVAGLQAGVTLYDASIGGTGGCPFAPRASGNISTEDCVHMLHEMGIDTGIDLDALIECARLAERIIGRELPGQVMKAGKRSELAVA
ncbi:MAG: hydroxymethylglutaryl-CoA lyase [Chloroflexi bacterium]|nr:hydroxymethylglutaryl-CoA lyase [Chloroflexota bacterium]